MMRRHRKRSRKWHAHAVHLNITSLADILVVVLVFLLKSLSTSFESADLTVPGQIALPQVSISSVAKFGIKVQISDDAVEIDGRRIASLEHFKFQDAKGINSPMMTTAFEDKLFESGSQIPSVWIIADRRAPYSTIQTVIASAAYHGFSDFKLAVVKDDQ